jgi:hypothetical protein
VSGVQTEVQIEGTDLEALGLPYVLQGCDKVVSSVSRCCKHLTEVTIRSGSLNGEFVLPLTTLEGAEN